VEVALTRPSGFDPTFTDNLYARNYLQRVTTMDFDDAAEAYRAAMRRWHDRLTDNSLIIGQFELLLREEPVHPVRLKTQSLCLMRENEALANLIQQAEQEVRRISVK
jgi:hypothetical protein